MMRGIEPVATVGSGRDESGRFAVGNSAASGHRRRQRMAELRSAFTAAVTNADIENIVRTMVRMAIDGDAAAAKLVLDRALGKPNASESEDPPPEEQRPLTIAELGPVTEANVEQHRAARMALLQSRGGE